MGIEIIELEAPGPGNVKHYEVPAAAKLLYAQNVDGRPVITALADPECPTETRKIGCQVSNVPLARLGNVASFQGSVVIDGILQHYFEVH